MKIDLDYSSFCNTYYKDAEEVADITIDDKEVRVYADTTWGWYAYFGIDGKWYKMNVFDSEEIRGQYTIERGKVNKQEL